ncbi:thioesterase [Chryseobacterium lactis]|uniref:Thioesterase n=1 Tax=Chryseobacterium lactis TaxID=1241981 RepID=A0A3G6RWY1_CHRLC|nr:thioesterase domain-containing protein [Chryseobacterium lactis]AZA81395.1 thioesterase [Chryseobacterium lactis]AZB06394.1 thioesterase [Chryseobacterium lactis]PNW15246.1 thioesterase [Chryseobacterium lactis]
MNTISSKPQLFLLHYAGGDRNSFRPLLENLHSYFQIETPELPGRGNRMAEPFLKNKKEAVEELLDQIKKTRQKNVPYLIYGHSMGAILGLEICRIMEENGDGPEYFIPTGYPGPNIKNNAPIAGLPRAEFFAEVKKLGGLSDEVMEIEELLDFFEPVLRADFGLLENKENKPFEGKIQTPVYAIMGKTEQYALNIRNWKNYTDADCECHIVNGNHFFINQNFNYLAQVIKNLINITLAK